MPFVKNVPGFLLLSFLLCGFYLILPVTINYSITPKWIGFAFLTIISSLLLFQKGGFLFTTFSIYAWGFFTFQYLLSSYFSHNPVHSIYSAFPLIISPIAVCIVYSLNPSIISFYKRLADYLCLILLPIIIVYLAIILHEIYFQTYTHLTTYDFKLSFGNRNPLAHFLVLCIPFIFNGLIFKSPKSYRWLYSLTIILISVLLILLQNRTALIVLFVVYPFFLICYQIHLRNKTNVIFTIFSALLVLGLILWLNPNLLKTLLEYDYGSGRSRIILWQKSIDLWRENPLFGIGSGNWKIEILRSGIDHELNPSGKIMYQRAHNDFIQILTENGLLGLISFLTFIAFAFFGIIKSKIQREFKIIMLSGVVAFLVISFFSFPQEDITLLFLLFLFLIPSFNYAKKKRINRITKTSIILTITIILFFSIKIAVQEYYFKDFKVNNNINALNRINNRIYTLDHTNTPIAFYRGNEALREKDLPKAKKLFLSALKCNPYHIHSLDGLGSCYSLEGSYIEAVNHYNSALRINENFSKSKLHLAYAFYKLNDFAKAEKKIMEINPLYEPEQYKQVLSLIFLKKFKTLKDTLLSKANIDHSQLDTLNMYYLSLECRKQQLNFEELIQKKIF